MRRYQTETGFAAVESLLIVIIIAALVGVGAYVLHAQEQTNATLDAASKSAQSSPGKITKKSTSATTDVTAKWFLYISPGHKFSMRLPNGWKLEQYQNSDAIYAYGDSMLATQEGKTATVTTVQGGKDGPGSGIVISFQTDVNSLIAYNQFTKGMSFKTTSGLNVDVYTRTETEDSAGIGSVDKGGKYYHYIITSSANKIVLVSYGFNHDETDYHSTVEQAVKTININ